MIASTQAWIAGTKIYSKTQTNRRVPCFRDFCISLLYLVWGRSLYFALRINFFRREMWSETGSRSLEKGKQRRIWFTDDADVGFAFYIAILT